MKKMTNEEKHKKTQKNKAQIEGPPKKNTNPYADKTFTSRGVEKKG